MSGTRSDSPSAKTRGPAPKWKPVTSGAGKPSAAKPTASPKAKAAPKTKSAPKTKGASAARTRRPAAGAPYRPASGRKPTTRRNIAMLVALSLLTVGSITWMTLWFTSRGEIRNDTTIAGVQVGGLTPSQAERTLQTAVEAKLADPIVLMIDGERVELVPADAGLAVDVPASVAQAAVTTSVTPASLWRHYTDSAALAAVVTVKEGQFRRAVTAINSEVGSAPRDARVTITAAGAKVTAPRNGLAVDREQVRSILLAQWYDDQDRTAMLSLSDTEPDIGQAEVAAFKADFLNPALSGPVTLKFRRNSDSFKPAVFKPARFGPTITVRSINGTLEGKLDNSAFFAMVSPSVRAAAVDAVDARVELVNGRPTVIDGVVGHRYTVKAATDAFLSVLLSTGDRSAPVASITTRPAFTTAEAKALRIRRVVGVSSYTGDRTDRRPTISVDALNGLVVRPGASVDLDTVIASGGRLVRAPLRDAMGQAGIAVSGGRFTNTTGHGILVQVGVDLGKRTVDLDNRGSHQGDRRPGGRHGHRDDDRTRTTYRPTVSVQVWGA